MLHFIKILFEVCPITSMMRPIAPSGNKSYIGVLEGQGGSMLIPSFRTFSLLTLSGLLLVGSVTASAADRCDKRIRDAERSLQQAVARHGEHSRQAEQKRRHLEDVRRGCHR